MAEAQWCRYNRQRRLYNVDKPRACWGVHLNPTETVETSEPSETAQEAVVVGTVPIIGYLYIVEFWLLALSRHICTPSSVDVHMKITFVHCEEMPNWKQNELPGGESNPAFARP